MRVLVVSAAAVIALMIAGTVAWGQGGISAGTPNMLERFSKGLSVVRAAAEAAGGAQTVRGITSLSFTARGDTYNDVQGFHAARIGNPERDGRLTVVNDFDFAGARFSQRTIQELAGGFAIDTSTLYRNGTSYALRNNGKEYLQTPNAPSPAGPGGLVTLVARWCPPLLLQRALQNARSIAWVGEGVVAGAPAEIVEFSFDEVTRFRLYVAKSGHKIVRMEAVAPDAVVGDDVSIVEFDGTQNVGGLAFPARLVAFRRGVRTFAMAIENVAVNPVLPDALFQPPPTHRLVSDDAVTTKKLNGRIYEVSGLGGGNYRSQFVVMEDFVVAFEAPLGIPVTRQIIAEIRKVAGDKPIRYVVVSHFHSDHAGGIGAYADLGATVVSAAENKDVLQTYARARSLSQGLGGRSDVQLAFQPVGPEGAEIVDARGNRLRVIGFRTPHVDLLLTLYDPETRTVIEGDLFSRLVRWNKTFDVFARWLRRNDPPVDLILGTHHEPISRDALLATARESAR